MDFAERQRLCHRITSSTLYGSINFNNDNYSVIISDPSLQVSTEADFIYKKIYDSLKSDRVLTLEESYSILKDQGVWDEKFDKELDDFNSLLEDYRKQLPKLRFKKLQFKATKQLIEETQTKVCKLLETKNQLYHSTIEFLSSRARKRFIISKVTQIEPLNLLENPMVQDLLCVYYYDENAIGEAEIRELARSDPWRLYWIASKDTGTPLFRHSCTEMTDLQYALVSWSRIYDFAYESQERPSNDIVEDDEAFDVWYKGEADKINSERSKNNLNINASDNAEVFIPADAEGASEVYSLNDAVARKKIKDREKLLDKKGEAKDIDFVDVRNQVNMDLNKMRMQKR